MNALRFATRQLIRNPAFNAVVVLTLALGIGASTLIFSVIDGVLLEPLPYPQSDRIARVYQVNEGRGTRGPVSDPNFADVQERSRSFAALAQFGGLVQPVAGGSEPTRTFVAYVSQDFHDVLGVTPLHGRGFAPDELNPGAAPAVLVSHSYWQRYLEGAADFESRSLRIGDRPHAIVGVMPPGFDFPNGAQLWAPRELIPINPQRTAHNMQVVGRLAPGVSLEQARADSTAIARGLKAEHGGATWMVDAAIVPLHEDLVGSIRPALLVLGAAVTLLFFVACANVVSMLLARAVVREQELAIRAALGAGRFRLARQFLAEILVLCAAGGALGVVLAWWGLDLLGALHAGTLPRADALGIDGTTLAFATILSVLAAGALSALLAWRATGERVAVNANRRGAVGGRRSRLREGLVAAQIAVALVLIVGAVLLGRSFQQLIDVDPGFRTSDLVLMHVALPRAPQDADPAPLASFHEDVIARLRALPGVEAVGGVTFPPLAGDPTSSGTLITLNHSAEIETMDDIGSFARDPARSVIAEFRVASEGYFAAMGIPLLRGRLFERSDGPQTAHAAVLSRSLAELKWPGEDPIGKLLQFGNMDGDLTPFTVVGVVGDVHEFGVDTAPRPTFYGYHLQRPRVVSSFWIAIHAPNAERTVPAARQIVQNLNSDVPPRFRTAEEMFSASLAQRRFNLTLLGVFGGGSLLLALAGIYGAIAFNVAQRTQEIGVRMALGARATGVVAMVVRRSLMLAAAGIFAGLAAALGTSRLIESLLYEVSSRDPLAYAAAAATLLLAAALASWLPAARAARVDPITALRHE
jgi:predicted permease